MAIHLSELKLVELGELINKRRDGSLVCVVERMMAILETVCVKVGEDNFLSGCRMERKGWVNRGMCVYKQKWS